MGYDHQKRRAAMLPPQGERCPCTGCAKHPGRPCLILMWPGNTDADHIVPRILGGDSGPLRHMCRSCNRSRGATLGNRMRGARRAVVKGSQYIPRASRDW